MDRYLNFIKTWVDEYFDKKEKLNLTWRQIYFKLHCNGRNLLNCNSFKEDEKDKFIDLCRCHKLMLDYVNKLTPDPNKTGK